MPMPSPKYMSAGSLKKLGTDVKGICGTFSALALDWAESDAPATISARTTPPTRAPRLIEASWYGRSGGTGDGSPYRYGDPSPVPRESSRYDPVKSKFRGTARSRPAAGESALRRHQPGPPIGGHRPPFRRLLEPLLEAALR